MKIAALYILSIGLLLIGLYFMANPYNVYYMQVCVTQGYTTTCHNEIIRSFQPEAFLGGVFIIITAIGHTIAITLVIIIIRLKKRKVKKYTLIKDER
ncbi:MAG: hypothetical protein ACFFG0_06435 [Candidatus Thorarchaeota archaeon]